MNRLELLSWGLWMARKKFFLAHELVPQAGMASETTRPQGFLQGFDNSKQVLLCSWVVKGTPSHHMEEVE